MKIDFKIAIVQQTRARDQILEGVLDSGCPRDSHAHIWSHIIYDISAIQFKNGYVICDRDRSHIYNRLSNLV